MTSVVQSAAVIGWLYALFTIVGIVLWLNNIAVIFPSKAMAYLYPGCIDHPSHPGIFQGFSELMPWSTTVSAWVWNILISAAFYGHHSLCARGWVKK